MTDDRQLRHACGRPHSRWEDIFVRWKGLDWRREAAREDWKSLKGVFVEFALHDAKESRKHPTEKMLTLQHVLRAERPLPEPTPLRDLVWQPLCSARRRLELTGDSLLVVNWANGNWPVRQSLYASLICSAMYSFWRFNEDFGVEPKQKSYQLVPSRAT